MTLSRWGILISINHLILVVILKLLLGASYRLTLTPLRTIKGKSRGTIKYTKSDCVIKRRYKWAPTRWPASDTGWLGIPGHVLGVREVRRSKPGGTNRLLWPNLAGERRERISVRVIRRRKTKTPLRPVLGKTSFELILRTISSTIMLKL